LSISGKDLHKKAEPKLTVPAAQKVSVVGKVLKSRIFLASLFLIALGFTCLFLENTFYQYLDEDGVLHESFFLPFGCLSLITGGLGLLITVIKIVWSCFRQ
jgi:hypothetical protein